MRVYRGVVVRLLTKMRLDGELPWSWITDGTRWMHKSVRYGSVEEALEATRQHYRRDYWRELDDYVEVWLEKDALAGVLYRVTDEWGVPLMVTRGFASLSYVHNAAETIERVGKPTFIYYFGDYDPSGVEIDRNLERRLREFAPYSRSTSSGSRCDASRSRSTRPDTPDEAGREPRPRTPRGGERRGRRASARRRSSTSCGARSSVTWTRTGRRARGGRGIRTGDPGRTSGNGPARCRMTG